MKLDIKVARLRGRDDVVEADDVVEHVVLLGDTAVSVIAGSATSLPFKALFEGRQCADLCLQSSSATQ